MRKWAWASHGLSSIPCEHPKGLENMSRPLVSVYDPSNSDTGIAQTTLPAVMTAPIRPDIVNYVHNLMSKNKRQAYGVNKLSGMQVR